MRPLSQGELLEVWERGLGQSSLDRTLALLGLACTENAEEFTVGESDRRLLELRELMFGPQVKALAHCPQCDTALELNFNVADVRVRTEASERQLLLSDAGYEASIRIPTLGDLKTLREATSDQLEKLLLGRCLLRAGHDGQAVALEELPEAFIHVVSERMGEADPQAEICLELECPGCHHRWPGDFDVESFFWAEIQAWAGRMLNEVHQLAAAYGWSEGEILALSPMRRHLYLNLVTD